MQLRATRLTAIASAVKRAFNISSLFAGGEQGVWYDPSDYTTLFQDSAGTTPVTAVEQPVGLMLDKSQGLVLGPELVVNGTFPVSIADWTVASGAAAIRDTTIFASGGIRVQGGGTELTAGVRQVLSGLVVGKSYKVVAEAYAPSANGITNGAVISLVSAPLIGGPSAQVSAEDVIQNITFTFVAAATSVTIYLFVLNRGVAWGTSSDYAYFDNISVKELPGNHAFQSTSASRPVLSARYNLLTKTEQFDDAVWIKDNVTVTANAVVAPDGTTTADRIVEAATTAFHRVYVNGISVIGGVNYALSVYARAGERDFLALFFTTGGASGAYFNLANGTIGTVGTGFVASITSAGDGWYRCSISITPSTSATFYPLIGPAPANGTASYAGDITKGIFLWGAQLEVST